VFLINLPIGTGAAAVICLFMEERWSRVSAPIDWWGGLLLSVAIVLLLQAQRSWMVGLAGLASLAAFLLVERSARAPIVPLHLLRQRTIAIGVVSFALLGAAMMVVIFFTPLYVQGVLGLSAATAGSAVAPMLVGWPIAATVSGRYLVRTGFAKPIGIGSVLVALSLAAFFASVLVGLPTVALQFTLLCCGVGLGCVNTALIVALQTSVRAEVRGVVTGLATFARTMGGALGVSALGVVMAARLRGYALPRFDVPNHLTSAAPALTHLTGLRDALLPVFGAATAVALLNLAVVALWPRSSDPASRVAAVA
jgi:hypothetical protein